MQLTSERFESVGLEIFQPISGYRYGAESLALAAFAQVQAHERVLELGSGVGVISLLLAAQQHPAGVVALEIQEVLHALALQNVERNGFGDRVQCVCADHRAYAPAHAGAFDVVVANPPFFRVGNGRVSPDPIRACARHELHGTLDEVCRSAALALRPRGRFSVVMTRERFSELTMSARNCGLILQGPVVEGEGTLNYATFVRICNEGVLA